MPSVICSLLAAKSLTKRPSIWDPLEDRESKSNGLSTPKTEFKSSRKSSWAEYIGSPTQLLASYDEASIQDETNTANPPDSITPNASIDNLSTKADDDTNITNSNDQSEAALTNEAKKKKNKKKKKNPSGKNDDVTPGDVKLESISISVSESGKKSSSIEELKTKSASETVPQLTQSLSPVISDVNNNKNPSFETISEQVKSKKKKKSKKKMSSSEDADADAPDPNVTVTIDSFPSANLDVDGKPADEQECNPPDPASDLLVEDLSKLGFECNEDLIEIFTQSSKLSMVLDRYPSEYDVVTPLRLPDDKDFDETYTTPLKSTEVEEEEKTPVIIFVIRANFLLAYL
jgi:hypothetical protein